MAHRSVHKMARSDWLVTGPYFRVRTCEMDPVRWTAPNNLCRKLRSCMSHSGCVILTESEESSRIYYRNPRCGIHSAKPLQNPPKKCRKAGNYFACRKAKAP